MMVRTMTCPAEGRHAGLELGGGSPELFEALGERVSDGRGRNALAEEEKRALVLAGKSSASNKDCDS
jgi:hypothetical protein